MNDYQRAKLTSYRKTLTALDRYPDEVAAVPALQRSVEWVRGRVQELEDAAEKQATYVAQSEAKDAKRQDLADAAVPVAQALSAKAEEDGDSAAADLFDFSESDFLYGPEQDAIDRGRIVRGAALAADPTALGEYGVSGADVAALTAALDAFREALTVPQDEIAKRSANTEAVERLVPEIGEHLRKRTDRMMTKYRKTAFGAEYKTARTILDP